ncbi:MAG: V-type ATPase subunit [Candidatus Bathyarchaeia archaeon]
MKLGLTYVVIRSHALIADLMTPEQMGELAEQGTIADFTEKLAGTIYGTIAVEEGGDPSIALEKEFFLKFIERMTKIVDIAPTKMGKFLQAYYYLRFEVLNLKRILRGKFSELPVEEIKGYLVPMEPYQVPSYEELVEAESLEETVAMLRRTPYSSIEASLEFVKEYDALWPIEQALNHLYAITVLKSLDSLSQGDRTLVRSILRFEVNVENLLNAIKHRRLKKDDQEAQKLEELFPITFDIDLDKIKALIDADDLRTAVQDLGAPYDEILSPIYEGDVALIRARVRRHTYEIVSHARAVDNFGFNVIMAYLIFSELEKNDLVGIAWGITQGISAEDLTKYLSVSES